LGESRFNETSQSTRVLNLSVLVYKTSQEIHLLRDIGWTQKPDSVKLPFCLHDVDDHNGEFALLDPSNCPLVAIGYRHAESEASNSPIRFRYLIDHSFFIRSQSAFLGQTTIGGSALIQKTAPKLHRQ